MSSIPRWIAKAVLSLPWLGLYWLYRAGLVQFATGSCALALVPGKLGNWWRRRWYQRTLRRCGRYVQVNWMSVILSPETCLGNGIYIGHFCSVHTAEIGDSFLMGDYATILSGGRQHGTERLDIPMTDQAPQPRTPMIADDVWIGARATIMADVARGSVVGAGAVVTRTFEPYSIMAGIPAQVLRKRGPVPETAPPAS